VIPQAKGKPVRRGEAKQGAARRRNWRGGWSKKLRRETKTTVRLLRAVGKKLTFAQYVLTAEAQHTHPNLKGKMGLGGAGAGAGAGQVLIYLTLTPDNLLPHFADEGGNKKR
jgi:hypothetical protein